MLDLQLANYFELINTGIPDETLQLAKCAPIAIVNFIPTEETKA